jgi:uncharacterized protein
MKALGVPHARPSRSRWLFLRLRAIAMAYALAAIVVFIFQRSLIYHPVEVDLPAWSESLVLEREGLKIYTLVSRAEGPDACIYFGGNAEDAAHGLLRLRELRPEDTVYAMYYRGYGPSEGDPNEEALVGDARALFDRLRPEHPRLTLVGRSLGSGVATALAAQREVDGLILITPFDRLASPASRAMPFFPVSWMLRDRFESARHVLKVKAPTLILAAGRDAVMPANAAPRLERAFPAGVAKRVTVAAAKHNDILQHEAAASALRGFKPRAINPAGR